MQIQYTDSAHSFTLGEADSAYYHLQLLMTPPPLLLTVSNDSVHGHTRDDSAYRTFSQLVTTPPTVSQTVCDDFDNCHSQLVMTPPTGSPLKSNSMSIYLP